MQTAAFEDEDFAVPVEEEIEGPMMAFLKEIEELTAGCDKIDAKIKDIKKLQSEILSSPNVDRSMQSQMDDIMTEIKKIANVVRSKLKKIEHETDHEERARGHVTLELRIRKTQQMTTSRRFVGVMTEYNQIQVDYREASKQQIKRRMELVGQEPSDEELEQMLEGGGGAQLTGHIQIEAAQLSGHIQIEGAQLNKTLGDIQQRHEMFIKLETSIKELHEMFMDISVFIENQGEMVDRITSHVESAEKDTYNGTKYARTARDAWQKARRKKVMLLLCVIIGGSLGTYIGLKYLNIL